MIPNTNYNLFNGTSVTLARAGVLNATNIKETWSINKDKISICKDCEYRYCCTDCRVFIDNPKDMYSRPSKCNYNPYIGLWDGEEGYVEVNKWLKQNNK